MVTARQAALNVLVRVEKEQAYVAAALASELRGVKSSKEAALATELVLGVTRRKPFLDKLLGQVSTRGIGKIDTKTKNILRLGAYQIAFLDSIPDRAAVSESVELAKRSSSRHLARFINALLRRISEMDPADLRPREEDCGGPLDGFAVDFGLPRFLLKRLADTKNRQWVFDVAKTFNHKSRRTLRINVNQLSREAAIQEMGGQGLAGALTPWSIDVPDKRMAEKLISSGKAVYQDEGAQLAVLALEAEAGETILDACAGRGGKTSALAMCAGSGAAIWAVDRGENKLARLAFELAKQGFQANTRAADLTDPNLDLAKKFDKILLDAPCSGTGTMGRRPEIRWRLTPEMIASLVRIQSNMLDAVVRFLKPGGCLIYVVCSLLLEEGLLQGEAFTKRHSDMVPNQRVPRDWPVSVPWNQGRVFVDPAQHGTDGYQILSFCKQKAGSSL